MVKKDFDTIEEREGDFFKEGSETRYLLLKHFDRLSKYIFGGEKEPSLSKTGESVVKTDRREVICSGIDFITALAKPHYDEKMKEEQKKFETNLNKIEQGLYQFILYSIVRDSAEKEYNRLPYKPTQEDWTKIFENHKKYFAKMLMPIDKESGYYERFIYDRLKLYMELFTQINHLLKRKNWIATTQFDEEK